MEKLNRNNKWELEPGMLLEDSSGFWIIQAIDYDGYEEYNRNARTIALTIAPLKDGRMINSQTVFACPVSKCYGMNIVSGSGEQKCYRQLIAGYVI